MSYAIGTTHYNLPQTQGTDKRDWSDTNQAFTDIDAAIYGAVTDSATAVSTASSASSTATSAASDAASAVTTANAASATAQTASEAAALARTEAQSAVTTANAANTTAQAASANASTAIGNVGDLTQLTTTDKDSAVDAINEVLAGITSSWTDINNLHQLYIKTIGNMAICVFNALDMTVTTAGQFVTILNAGDAPLPINGQIISSNLLNGLNLNDMAIVHVNANGSVEATTATTGQKSLVGVFVYPI